MIGHSEFAYVIDASGHDPLHLGHRPGAGNRGHEVLVLGHAGRHHRKRPARQMTKEKLLQRRLLSLTAASTAAA